MWTRVSCLRVRDTHPGIQGSALYRAWLNRMQFTKMQLKNAYEISLFLWACTDCLFFLYLGAPNRRSKYSHIMKIEEIQQQCETLSNEQLFLIVNNKRLYTEKIVGVAYQEIKKRGLSKRETKEIKKVQALQSRIITGDIHEDIFLLEKIGFFSLGFLRVLNALILRDYKKKGFVLKVRQAQYYILLGVAFLLIAVFLGRHFNSFSVGAIIWASGFLCCHLFNKYYFKAATIRRLAARTASPGPE
jgi:hypothetical protein